MYVFPTIDVDIDRNASGAGLRWPKGEEVETDSGLGCNREYADLRRMTWRDYAEVAQAEDDLFALLVACDDPEEELDQLEAEAEEAEETGEPDPLMGLDVGIASTVIALSAAGCIPVSSCNGGVFGRRHHERHPLVVFCAREPHLSVLNLAATEADIGLINSGDGFLLAYSGNIERMRDFARSLAAHRADFRQLRFRRPKSSKAPQETRSRRRSILESDHAKQLRLPGF